MSPANEFRANLCRRKMALCVRNARAHRREAWNRETSPRERKEFRRLSAEAMHGVCGARWWRTELHRALAG